MKNISSFQSESKIQLGETFIRLSTGITNIIQVAAERRAEREAVLAREDDYARRRRFRIEVTDPFTANFYL
jgi:hypothetical protein